MSAQPARRGGHLRPVEATGDDAVMARMLAVDPETGESIPAREVFGVLEDQIAGLEKDVRSWRARYADLSRDVEKDARKHHLWPKAVEAFQYWKKACKHPKSAFDAKRFELVRPFLEKHDLDLVKRAIDGAAFDPFTKRRPNGTVKRFDDWALIFRDADKFEDFANRAPLLNRGEQATLDA